MCALFLALIAAAQTPPVEFPVTALKPALAEARAADRLVVAEFWTMKTEPSRSYRTTTLSSPAVLGWLGTHAVGARVNVDFNAKICAQLAVVDVPTLLVLDAGAVVWGRIAGEKKPEEIVAELEAARVARTAFAEAEAALASAPDDARALRTRVESLVRNEKPAEAEKALAHLARVSRETQGREALALRIGDLYFAARQDPDAKRIYVQAADWARTGDKNVRPPAVIALAAIELRGNRPDKAVEILLILLGESDRFPERSKALFILGEAYLTKLGDRAKAKEALLRLRENYNDRYSEAAKSLLRYIELQEKGLISPDGDDFGPTSAK